MSQRRELDQLTAFIAGGCGGVSNVLIGYPFDTLKVKLQTSNEYKGLVDCFKQTIAKSGVRGLYRGITSPLLGVTPMWALSFWSYEMGQRMVIYCRDPSMKSKPLSLFEIALAGCWSSVPTTIVTTPMERLKVILQTQGQTGSTTKYTGMFDALKGVLKENGVRGLYRGTVATLMRDIPGGAVYFATYEFVYRSLKVGDSISVPAALFAGGMSGVAMWSVAIPADVVKSRIQASAEGTYRGFLDCAGKIVREGGIKALYKGFGPAMIRAFPANAAGWMGRMGALEVIHSFK
ncbi:mitochondrial carrier domain-containing protein [Obelidium mucronatum]|nr:mitochondrial carrier domain-containing protein [Obelidium mucronatum]